MNAILATAGTIGLVSTLAAFAGRAQTVKVPPGATPENLITQILLALREQRAGNDADYKRAKDAAAKTAAALGLDVTAEAVRAGAPLPTAEDWPGTNMSVRAYVAEKRQEAGV